MYSQTTTQSVKNDGQYTTVGRLSDSEARLLALDQLSKHYNRFVAVDDISLTVYPGELTAIIGPNGEGKTTLFNLLTGQLLPSKGALTYKGRDITTSPLLLH